MIKTLFLASRPKTLTASVIPVIAGTALAKLESNISYNIFIYTLLSAILIQVATNFINDALDFKKGTDNHERLGPDRLTQKGRISPDTLLNAAYACFGFSMLIAVPLVIHGGMPILAVGLVSILLAYAYTDGPYPISYNGLGEIFVILFFGIIAVTGTFYLQTLSFNLYPIILGLQIGLLATTLIAINNFRDRQQDLKANKKTLVVRFGTGFGKFIVIASLVLPYIIGYFWIRRVPPAFYLVLLTIPLAFHIIVNFLSAEPSKKCNKFLEYAAFLHLLFGILISTGFILWS